MNCPILLRDEIDIFADRKVKMFLKGCTKEMMRYLILTSNSSYYDKIRLAISRYLWVISSLSDDF